MKKNKWINLSEQAPTVNSFILFRMADLWIKMFHVKHSFSCRWIKFYAIISRQRVIFSQYVFKNENRLQWQNNCRILRLIIFTPMAVSISWLHESIRLNLSYAGRLWRVSVIQLQRICFVTCLSLKLRELTVYTYKCFTWNIEENNYGKSYSGSKSKGRRW